MTSIVGTSLKSILFSAVAITMAATGAWAEGYKGAVFSDTLVFDVTYVSGDTVRVETWFTQWVGNVYSDTLETGNEGFSGTRIRMNLCESASWIAAERHIWKEGDPPYMTRSHKMKLRRLENSIKRSKCRKVTEDTQRVSRRALRNATDWIKSRDLDTVSAGRDHSDIGSVEGWVHANIDGVVSIRLNMHKTPRKSPIAVAELAN